MTEIAKDLSLNKGTVWGLVTTLEKCGLLEKDKESGKYCLGPKVYELGMIYSRGLDINKFALEPLSRLAVYGPLRANLGIWDGSSILLTLTVLSKTMTTTAGQIGPRLVAYCTATGKAALAFLNPTDLKDYLRRTPLNPFTPFTITNRKDFLKDLDAVRQRGYAIDREEYVIGVAGLGAPVFDKSGRVNATVSIGGNPSIILGDRMEEMAGALRSTASEISAKIGYFP